MSKITNYFAQPMDPPKPSVEEPVTPSLTNQQICLNMESVLAAVSKKKKRKHKKKHHRKDKDVNATETSHVVEVVDDDPKEIKANDDPVATTSQVSLVLTDSDDDEWNKPAVEVKNAFSVMMAARVKVIGDNVEGKVQSVATATSTISKKRNRTELLQKWAESKGGRKRQEAEKNREEYVEKQLEKRKSRFKKMLNGSDEVKEMLPKKEKQKPRRSMREKKPNKAYAEYRSKIKTIVSSTDEDTTDDEVDEFVEKLNSPLKDKSNILGYLKRETVPKQRRLNTKKNNKKAKISSSDCSTDDEAKEKINSKTKPKSDESTDDEQMDVQLIEELCSTKNNETLSRMISSDGSTEEDSMDEDLNEELCKTDETKKERKIITSDDSTDEEPIEEETLNRLASKVKETTMEVVSCIDVLVDMEMSQEDPIVSNNRKPRPIISQNPPKLPETPQNEEIGALRLDSFKQLYSRSSHEVLPNLESGLIVKVNVVPADIRAFHRQINCYGHRWRKHVNRIARVIRFASATLHHEKLDLPYNGSVRRANSLTPVADQVDIPHIRRISSMRSQSLSPTNIDIAEMDQDNTTKRGLQIGSLRHSEGSLCDSSHSLQRSRTLLNFNQEPVVSPLRQTESILLRSPRPNSPKLVKPIASPLLRTETVLNLTQSPPEVRSGRPRRSCTLNRINYGSPEKPKIKRHAADEIQKPSAKRQKRDKDANDDTIIVDDDSNDEPAKLAPIFKKRLPKPAVDPKVAQAKRDFLQSGLPEVMQKEKDEQRQYLEVYEEGPVFPVISHVAYEQTKNLDVVDWTQGKFKLSPETDFDIQPTTKFKFNIAKVYDMQKLEMSFAKIVDTKSHKRHLKAEFEKFPVNKAFHQLQPRRTSDEGLLFVDKYRPTSSDHFLVNHIPVLALKKFLSNWTADAEPPSDNSDDDFEGSQGSLSSSPSNVILLHGPTGSGKTSSVMALANEMNFNVLEVNAGAERNGKKMLKDLLEATKSHGAQDSKKLALILIEDADILFPEDDGFLNGLNQLIVNSKRPVILTAINKSAIHLQKYSGNSLEYKSAATLPISKWLTCLAACEEFNVELNDVERLYATNKGDLRKTLMQLEFYLGSGGDIKCAKETEKHRNISSFFLPEEKKPMKIPETCSEMAKYIDIFSFASQLNSESSQMPNLGADIAIELKQRSFFTMTTSKQPSSFLYTNLETFRMNSRTGGIEYEPILRQICRTEATRNQNGRKCRMSHYLRDTLRFPTPSLDFFNKFSCIFTEEVCSSSND